jgi:hypothetical protein
MFAFADVMHLLTYEFTRLSAGGLAFTRVVASTLDGFSFRHKTSFVETNRFTSSNQTLKGCCL